MKLFVLKYRSKARFSNEFKMKLDEVLIKKDRVVTIKGDTTYIMSMD
jgi:hypothetical protein